MIPGRYFLGLALPQFAKGKLATLRTEAPGTSFVAAEHYHLTLKFFGEAGSGPLAELHERCSQVSARPFILEIGGVGRFPDPPLPPRVLWAGLHRAPPQLFHLQQKLEDLAFQAGWEPSKHLYRPHITVANITAETGHNAALSWLKQHRDFATAPFRVEAFHLFRRCRETDRYLVEQTYPLTSTL